MNTTHSARVAALAHHMAFHIIMTTPCDVEVADQQTDAAIELWLGQHGYGDSHKDLYLTAEAMRTVPPIMVAAIRATATRNGMADPVAAGRLILCWADEAGLSRLAQRALH